MNYNRRELHIGRGTYDGSGTPSDQSSGTSLIQVSKGKGEMIFEQGDPNTSLYFLQEGRVIVFAYQADGRRFTFGLFKPPSLLGESIKSNCEIHPTAALAFEPASLVTFKRAGLSHLPNGQLPSLAMLLRAEGRDLQYLRRRALLLGTKSVAQRVAHALLELTEYPEGKIVQVNQYDVALLAHTTRETTNSLLSNWQSHGLYTATPQGRQRFIELRQPALLLKIHWGEDYQNLEQQGIQLGTRRNN